MASTIFEKYGNYFLEAFKDDKKLKIDVVINNEDMFAAYISSKLDFDPYFIRFQKDMIYIDGCVVQDECLEFEDINTMPECTIFEFINKHIGLLKNFLNNGLFMFAYSKEEPVFSVSIKENKNALVGKEIRNIYNKNKFATAPDFDDLDKVIFKDFYGDIVQCFETSKLDKLKNFYCG